MSSHPIPYTTLFADWYAISDTMADSKWTATSSKTLTSPASKRHWIGTFYYHQNNVNILF